MLHCLLRSMNLPQEVVVWRLLPAIRKEFVLGLKAKGYAQKDIAKKLNITPAAVSQYLSRKRANTRITLNESSRKEIRASIEIIAQSTHPKIALQELSRVVEYCRRQRILCAQCDIRKEACDICFGSR